MPAATVDHSQRICEVWACNLDEEMKKIRQVIRKYNYVAMGGHVCPGFYRATDNVWYPI
uniref:CCR4-NOT transcription complex subunit 7 n=1 Tax=Sciurus vulgaris TaxID=55149 RepID=A0A8D2D1N5_SCIVU